MLGLREAGILSASVVLAGGVAYLIWSYGPSPSREDRDKGPGTAGKGTGGEEEKEKGARRVTAYRNPTTMLGLREAGILSASVVLAGGVAYLIWSYGPSPSREDRDKGPGTAGKGTGEEEEKEKGARILELARHKTSKTVWETTPCGTLRWGNQDPIWPVSPRVQAPSARIQELSRPKRDLSAGGQWRKEEMAPSSTPNQRYHNTVRLSTPKSRNCEEVSGSWDVLGFLGFFGVSYGPDGVLGAPQLGAGFSPPHPGQRQLHESLGGGGPSGGRGLCGNTEIQSQRPSAGFSRPENASTGLQTPPRPGGVLSKIWAEKGARRAEATSQGAVIPAEAQKTSDKEKTSTPEEPRGTQVLVLGLEGAGKTSLLHCLSAGVLEQDIEPTGGFNAVSVSRDNLDVEFLEIGGGAGLRPYWQKYMSRALLLVFVVDSSDPKVFPVAKQHLMELLSNRPRLPLMVLANKQDLL
ncbi:unnamed protein product [Menidia menidia]|uniref:(Atlantic silverside) hypothetical protein n=1 Tax=Menidia menidia TaxID=238744 RepID=A0A8S4BGP9_9TELE|nr:unnamed protein product [Menidia menidia]